MVPGQVRARFWHQRSGGGSRSHLEELMLAACWNDPETDSGRPAAPFDHYFGFGFERLDGEAGFCADWIFTDEGETGHPLTFGNHQAHRQKGAK